MSPVASMATRRMMEPTHAALRCLKNGGDLDDVMLIVRRSVPGASRPDVALALVALADAHRAVAEPFTPGSCRRTWRAL